MIENNHKYENSLTSFVSLRVPCFKGRNLWNTLKTKKTGSNNPRKYNSFLKGKIILNEIMEHNSKWT